MELQGFAWPGKNFFPSRFGQRLVYYQFQLQKQVNQGSGKNRRTTWVTVYHFSFHEPFFILDPTGLVQVDPAGATMDLKSQTTSWSGLQEKERQYFCTQVIKEPPASFPPSTFLWGLFSAKFRLTETLIPMGSPVHVSGHLESKTTALPGFVSPGLTDFANKVINFQSRSLKNVKTLLDSNNDGKVSEKEYSTGYGQVAAFSVQKALKMKIEEKPFSIFAEVKSTVDNPLTIADTHETYLRDRLERFLWLKFASAILIIGAGTYFLILALKLKT